MGPSVRGALYYNPRSGIARSAETLASFREAVAERRLDFIEISRELDVGADVRARLRRDQRLFVAAGGDGTINTVVQALVNSEGILAVIPAGTFNHFARDLGIPLDLHAALDVAVGGETIQIDAARVNERFFLNNMSLGLYPEVVTQREKFRGRGRLTAYRYAFMWALRKYPHVALVVEAPLYQAIRTHVFMVSVNAYDLWRVGMEAPRQSLSGGFISVYWMPHMPRLKFARALAKYLGGRISSVDGLRSLRTTTLKLQSSSSKIRLGLDGEVMEMRPPLTVTVVPASLQVRIPRDPTRPRPV